MAHTDPHAAAAGHATAGHETSDVSLGGAPRFVIVMVVFLAIVFAFIYFVYVKWRSDLVAGDVPATPVAARSGDRLPPLPRLQTTPYVDIKAFRDAEAQVLDTYDWVDKEKGVVRIPVARAIDLLAERGLPAAIAGVPVQQGGAVAPATGATPAGQ